MPSKIENNFQEQEDKELEELTNLKKVGPVGDRKKKEGKKEPYWFPNGKRTPSKIMLEIFENILS